MPPSNSVVRSRWAAVDAGGLKSVWRLAPIAAVHLAALYVLIQTEYYEFAYIVGFLLFWTILNCFWLALLRRPGVSAALSLAFIVVLIQLSELKYRVLWQTVNFVDIMVVDPHALSYLVTIFPRLGNYIIVGVALTAVVLVLLWRIDPFRIRRRVAVAGGATSLALLTTFSFTHPFDPSYGFFPFGHVSNFARSGVDIVFEYMRHGYMESDAMVADRLRTTVDTTCQPARKPPHIIMIHDESAFDIRVAPNVRVPPGYGRHFRSFDGKQRNFVVEAAGGPSWYTEYNVFSGLSARSFGKFSYFVTRIAARRVERGLPNALRRCGYQTLSLYPAHGAFMAARSFQTTAGVQRFFDRNDMRARDVEPDKFYYDTAMQMIERERAKGPLFLFVYLSANHFPWTYSWRPELTPGWKDLGNKPVVEEYLRRQSIGMRDYNTFLERLQKEFPGERFMLVRYGDHQPDFATSILEPSLDEAGVVARLMANDPRYYTTYYALDGVNYRPVNVTSAYDTIEGPYLPMVVLEGAGLPLDPSFAEQKRIFERCRGLFYSCAGGAEAKRFNRLLIDAGLIKGL
jgi:hypothetical protein